MQAVSNAVTFLREKKIDTVHERGGYLARAGSHMNELRSIVRGKEQRLHDIDALLAADKTIYDLQPMYDEYSTIRWKGTKERFAMAHADELEKCKKAQRLLHKFGLTAPIDRKSLRTERSQLKQDIESLRPDVNAVQAELDTLKTVRYWVRKVIPNVLPARTENGNPFLRDAIGVSQNENELNILLERTAQQAIAPQQTDIQTETHRRQEAIL